MFLVRLITVLMVVFTLPVFAKPANVMEASNKGKLQKATFIKLVPNIDQEKALHDFLVTGSGMVKKTEPGTKIWLGLKADVNTFGIFDVFLNEAGRKAHFDGAVAAALAKNAPALISGSWDNGVVPNISNYDILSYKLSPNAGSATEASYITLKAKPGMEKELGEFLRGAASIIEQTEPKTLFWAALQLTKDSFAIFDTFLDNSGREAHFAGKVADALHTKAERLVLDGWDLGVLENAHHFNIIAKVFVN